MTWAPSEDVEANVAGRLTERQRARFHLAFVRPAYARVLGAIAALALGLVMLFTPETRGVGFVLTFVASTIGAPLVWDLWATRRDLAGGVVKSKTAHLTPMSATEVRASTHWVRVDGEKLTLGAFDDGTVREWYSRGGTFRFFYLPRTRRVVLHVHLDSPS